MTTRITIPDEHAAIVLPQQLYEEALSLLGLIYRNRRLQITPGIKGIAGDVLLAAFATVPNQNLVERIQRDRVKDRV